MAFGSRLEQLIGQVHGFRLNGLLFELVVFQSGYLVGVTVFCRKGRFFEENTSLPGQRRFYEKLLLPETALLRKTAAFCDSEASRRSSVRPSLRTKGRSKIRKFVHIKQRCAPDVVRAPVW
jgi:hypothetical protein